jgi:hypothetical protein
MIRLPKALARDGHRSNATGKARGRSENDRDGFGPRK